MNGVQARCPVVSRLQRRRLRSWIAVAFAAIAALAVVLAVIGNAPARGPAAPYNHGGFSEVSVATEDVVAGQASTVADGLAELGYWCVEPRSNDLTAQITCQSPERDVQVDLVAAPDGDVLYADIDLGAATTSDPSKDVGHLLGQVLDASFLKLWPQDRTTLEDLLATAQGEPPFMPFGSEAPPVDPEDLYSTHDQRTDNASWSLWSRHTGEPLALRIRTTALEDHSWPFGGRHYATSVSAATAALVLDGFTCAVSCYRASDGQTVDFDVLDGQIVTVRVKLRSSDDGHHRTEPSRQWGQAELPFLTPAVRDAVGQRVEESRIERRNWRGVVAGTPIDIIAVPDAGIMPDNRPAMELMVTIGIPLLYVE
ncbi:hypothetical protein [Arthrobacter sp. Br18]|uniref:hypothetical protein n=1 Tax=Arthrobacter sp. Br18 TaxID=1312954 RepID=UPI0004797811|nr:hypothetical protein [Arthrobacter sp. Br18]